MGHALAPVPSHGMSLLFSTLQVPAVLSIVFTGRLLRPPDFRRTRDAA